MCCLNSLLMQSLFRVMPLGLIFRHSYIFMCALSGHKFCHCNPNIYTPPPYKKWIGFCLTFSFLMPYEFLCEVQTVESSNSLLDADFCAEILYTFVCYVWSVMWILPLHFTNLIPCKNPLVINQGKCWNMSNI